MSIDLTKMVDEWEDKEWPPGTPIEDIEERYFLVRILKAMAAEIEANREEIEQLKEKVFPWLGNGLQPTPKR